MLGLVIPILGSAQATSNQYLNQSFRETFNLEGVRAILVSPQFQLFLIIIGIVTAVICVFYLWSSFKMLYADTETGTLRDIMTLSKSIKIPKIEAPHLQDFGSGRMVFAPGFALIDHKKEAKQSEKEQQDNKPPIRGEETQQRG